MFVFPVINIVLVQYFTNKKKEADSMSRRENTHFFEFYIAMQLVKKMTFHNFYVLYKEKWKSQNVF